MKKINIAIRAIFSKDKGRISIKQRKVLSLLMDMGYCMVNSGSKFLSGCIVKKTRNMLTEVDLIQLRKDFIAICENNNIKEKYLEVLQNRIGHVLSQTQVHTLKTIDIRLLKDQKDCAYFPFMNKIVKVDSKGIHFLRYSQVEEHIIDKQRKPFNVSSKQVEGGDFREFCKLITNNNDDWFLSLQTALGYLLLSNKELYEDKAIIIYDYLLGRRGEANGGTGKSLLIDKALSMLKNVAIIDGKRYDSRSRFVYQNVDESTNVILFDDVNERFHFDDIYSALTVGFEIERKGKQAVYLDYKEAPKFVITSNRLIKMDEGASADRRKFELFLYNYFGSHHTPIDEFGKRFFTEDWDATEYNKFFYFMFECVQKYLQNGLVEFLPSELYDIKLEAEIGKDWVILFDNMLEDIQTNEFLVDRRLVEDICKEDFGLETSPHTFTKKIKLYCKYKNLNFEIINSGSVQKFHVTSKEVIDSVESTQKGGLHE